MATKILLFKANYSQDPRVGFKGRRKERYEVIGKFVERMKRIQEKAKAVLGKVQKKIKKFTDKKQRERGIQSRGLSTTKYKGLEMANERKKIGEVD